MISVHSISKNQSRTVPEGKEAIMSIEIVFDLLSLVTEFELTFSSIYFIVKQANRRYGDILFHGSRCAYINVLCIIKHHSLVVFKMFIIVRHFFSVKSTVALNIRSICIE